MKWPVVIRAAALLVGSYMAYVMLIGMIDYLPEVDFETRSGMVSGWTLRKIQLVNVDIPLLMCVLSGYVAGRMVPAIELRHAFVSGILALTLWGIVLTVWHFIGIQYSPWPYTQFLLTYVAPVVLLFVFLGGLVAKVQTARKASK